MEAMRVFSFLIILLVVSSCSQQIRNQKELQEYAQKNKAVFVKEKKFKEMSIVATCIPKEFLAEKSVDSNSTDITFNFKIVSPEADFLKRFSSSYNEYRQFKWYLMNEAENFIYLKQEGKKVRPKIAQFEEQYELGRGCEYNIVFDENDIDPSTEATLVFNDEIFGMGKLKFQFDMPFITSIPINKKSYYNSL